MDDFYEGMHLLSQLKVSDTDTVPAVDRRDARREEIAGNTLLFWHPAEYARAKKGSGFCFVAVDWAAGGGKCDDKDIWGDPECHVKVVVRGSACFDGIRHMWWGNEIEEDGLGYLYYPNLGDLVSLLNRLRQIELEWCSSPSVVKGASDWSEDP